jgi:hypothetical protein
MGVDEISAKNAAGRLCAGTVADEPAVLNAAAHRPAKFTSIPTSTSVRNARRLQPRRRQDREKFDESRPIQTQQTRRRSRQAVTGCDRVMHAETMLLVEVRLWTALLRYVRKSGNTSYPQSHSNKQTIIYLYLM